LNKKNPEEFIKQGQSCLISILDQFRQKDVESVKNSERNSFYLYLMDEMPMSAKYLNQDLTQQKIVLLAQARLNVN